MRQQHAGGIPHFDQNHCEIAWPLPPALWSYSPNLVIKNEIKICVFLLAFISDIIIYVLSCLLYSYIYMHIQSILLKDKIKHSKFMKCQNVFMSNLNFTSCNYIHYGTVFNYMNHSIFSTRYTLDSAQRIDDAPIMSNYAIFFCSLFSYCLYGLFTEMIQDLFRRQSCSFL